jgi:hypothetical protein
MRKKKTVKKSEKKGEKSKNPRFYGQNKKIP